jgi:clorobiocin/coumermycin A biosynthesis protein CloN6/CouN6
VQKDDDLQCHSESKSRMHRYLDAMREFGYHCVYLEQSNLAPSSTPKKTGESTDAYIMPSLSHPTRRSAVPPAAGRTPWRRWRT